MAPNRLGWTEQCSTNSRHPPSRQFEAIGFEGFGAEGLKETGDSDENGDEKKAVDVKKAKNSDVKEFGRS